MENDDDIADEIDTMTRGFELGNLLFTLIARLEHHPEEAPEAFGEIGALDHEMLQVLACAAVGLNVGFIHVFQPSIEDLRQVGQRAPR